MERAAAWGLDNSYRRMPAGFHARLEPRPVAAPRLVAFNPALAAELGLDVDALGPEAAALFSGNLLAADAEPLAAAYAGHQFGHFVPQLGDGRAILLGERIDRQGIRRDIQLKGAGRTPFSRGGDGRAALGPVLREFLVSEAMHALGVPTTRALAAVATGEHVYRDRALPGAVLTRVAQSHIRVGTFQYFAARSDETALRQLTDHVIARHYPEAAGAERPAPALLEGVARRQAQLIARWMELGFIHGVMNTDNMAVSGETIDYGPCAFMDAYDPAQVFSSIDQGGRYAYANQPRIGYWNLARFAETLLGLIDTDADRAVELATAAIAIFPAEYDARWLQGMGAKIGLIDMRDGDRALIEAYLLAMQEARADFTLSFRRLADALDDEACPALRALFAAASQGLENWLPQWRARLAAEPRPDRAARMNTVNPLYIPRNHRVEEAIATAVESDDFQPFARLRSVVERPYAAQPGMEAYAGPPPPSPVPYRTFCGT